MEISIKTSKTTFSELGGKVLKWIWDHRRLQITQTNKHFVDKKLTKYNGSITSDFILSYGHLLSKTVCCWSHHKHIGTRIEHKSHS